MVGNGADPAGVQYLTPFLLMSYSAFMQTLFDDLVVDVPGSSAQAEPISMQSLATVDLFSGCGGLSLGLSKAGFSITHAFDSWAPAVQAYEANFNHGCSAVDLSDVDSSVTAIMQHDFQVIAGGPPCQDFSQAGSRVEGARANLTNCFAEIIVRCMPPLFIMENVEKIECFSGIELYDILCGSH